jgi:hypothetical protein
MPVHGPSATRSESVPLSKFTRDLVVPLALVGLIVVTTTLGNVWHHHDWSSERACPICHFNHQPIEKPLTGNRLPVLAPISASADVSQPSLEPVPDSRRIPSRAPPSA